MSERSSRPIGLVHRPVSHQNSLRGGVRIARDPRLRGARSAREHSLEGPRRAQRSEHDGRTRAAPPTGEHQNHQDHLGSPDTITNDIDSTVDHVAFGPFGEDLPGSATSVTRTGFTGHDHDRDLGLIDMKGRIYDPLAGSFASADPIVQAPFFSQGLNQYAYVFNDPINATDPSGFVVAGTWTDLADLSVYYPNTAASGAFAGGGEAASASAETAAGSAAGPGAGAGVGVSIGVFNVMSTLSIPTCAGTQTVRMGMTGSRAPTSGQATQGAQNAMAQNSGMRPPVRGASSPSLAKEGRPKVLPGELCTAEGGCDQEIAILPAELLAWAAVRITEVLESAWELLQPKPATAPAPAPAPPAAAPAAPAPAAAAAEGVPFEGFQAWGRPLWGRGAAGAQNAVEKMTPEIAKTLDPSKVRQALEFYKQAAAAGRGGEAALGRVRLMERILELM